MDLSHELAVALAAARTASEYVLAEYDAFAPIADAPADISTHVDRQAQELILGRIREAFPNDGIRAEESTPGASGTPHYAERVWIVDPIDGTRGFARKNGEFSVMIGFAIAGRVVLGVVAEPVVGRTTYATAGSGCWVVAGESEPVQCRVSRCGDLASATMVQSHTKVGSKPKPVVEAIRPAKVFETYSAGIKLAMVARGEVELYVNDYRNFHDWDACAGHILVEEAGGKMTLFDGGSVTYTGPVERRGLLATNGLLHEECVRRLMTI